MATNMLARQALTQDRRAKPLVNHTPSLLWFTDTRSTDLTKDPVIESGDRATLRRTHSKNLAAIRDLCSGLGIFESRRWHVFSRLRANYGCISAGFDGKFEIRALGT